MSAFCTLCKQKIAACICKKKSKELVALGIMRCMGLLSKSDYGKELKKITITTDETNKEIK